MTAARRTATLWAVAAAVLASSPVPASALVPLRRAGSAPTVSTRAAVADARGMAGRASGVVRASPQEEVPGGVEGVSTRQRVAIGVGSVGLLVVMANRLMLPMDQLYDSQSRTDLLAVMAIGGLVLNALGSLDVRTRTATPVELSGVRGRGLSNYLNEGGTLAPARATAAWVADALLQQLPATTVLVAWKGQPLLRQGVLPPPAGGGGARTSLGSGPIASRAFGEPAPVYLPALQNLPGKMEFNGWLPERTQSAVVAALGDDGVLVLGSDTARAFTSADLQAVFLLCQPLSDALASADAAGGGVGAEGQ